jgi:hypothetical protein
MGSGTGEMESKGRRLATINPRPDDNEYTPRTPEHVRGTNAGTGEIRDSDDQTRSEQRPHIPHTLSKCKRSLRQLLIFHIPNL